MLELPSARGSVTSGPDVPAALPVVGHVDESICETGLFLDVCEGKGTLRMPLPAPNCHSPSGRNVDIMSWVTKEEEEGSAQKQTHTQVVLRERTKRCK